MRIIARAQKFPVHRCGGFLSLSAIEFDECGAVFLRSDHRSARKSLYAGLCAVNCFSISSRRSGTVTLALRPLPLAIARNGNDERT